MLQTNQCLPNHKKKTSCPKEDTMPQVIMPAIAQTRVAAQKRARCCKQINACHNTYSTSLPKRGHNVAGTVLTRTHAHFAAVMYNAARKHPCPTLLKILNSTPHGQTRQHHVGTGKPTALKRPAGTKCPPGLDRLPAVTPRVLQCAAPTPLHYMSNSSKSWASPSPRGCSAHTAWHSRQNAANWVGSCSKNC
jgi:hypothetical protein